MEPFTLDTLLSNKLERVFDIVSFNQSENGIPNDVTAATELYANSSSGEYDVIRNSIF